MTWYYLGRYDRWPNGLSKYSSAKARGSRGGKRISYDYYVDDNGSLRIEKVTRLQKISPKPKEYKRKVFVCFTCKRKFTILVKKHGKDDNIINCPYCNEI